jgi:transcriptional regulator with XRE-family HTH domain
MSTTAKRRSARENRCDTLALSEDLFERDFRSMSIAERLRKLRESEGLTLDQLATKASVSKTYLWELERDTAGEKKPSADVLLRIASALSVTISDLLDLPPVLLEGAPVELPSSLQDFKSRMALLGTPLGDQDLRDLAAMKFRGGQPKTTDEWHQLYFTLISTTGRNKTR